MKLHSIRILLWTALLLQVSTSGAWASNLSQCITQQISAKTEAYSSAAHALPTQIDWKTYTLKHRFFRSDEEVLVPENKAAVSEIIRVMSSYQPKYEAKAQEQAISEIISRADRILKENRFPQKDVDHLVDSYIKIIGFDHDRANDPSLKFASFFNRPKFETKPLNGKFIPRVIYTFDSLSLSPFIRAMHSGAEFVTLTSHNQVKFDGVTARLHDSVLHDKLHNSSMQTNNVREEFFGARLPTEGEYVAALKAYDDLMATDRLSPIQKNIANVILFALIHEEGQSPYWIAHVARKDRNHFINEAGNSSIIQTLSRGGADKSLKYLTDNFGFSLGDDELSRTLGLVDISPKAAQELRYIRSVIADIYQDLKTPELNKHPKP